MCVLLQEPFPDYKPTEFTDDEVLKFVKQGKPFVDIDLHAL